MATKATAASATAQANRRNRLRDKRRNRGRVAAALRQAAGRGEFPDIGFIGYFTLADAITDTGVEATDADLDDFIEDCCGGGIGGGFELFESRLASKLEGTFIDLIKELLPVLLPLLIGCL